MPRNSDTFWSRVLFKDFIRHFRKMTPEQVAEDIAASMDALDDLNPDGDSFGSLMVRWANDRMNGAFATAARENGKKGGRPRKQETTADAPTREDGEFKSDSGDAGNLESATSAKTLTEARESRRTDGHSLRVGNVARPPVRSSGPMPANVQKVYDFASLEGLDKDDAYECWYVTTAERDGNDADGNPVTNWKAYVRTWCNTRSKKRSA